MVARVATEMKRVRESAQPKITAAKLAEETERFGLPISRAVISDLEVGRKKTLDLGELVVIARALRIPPMQLLYPELPDGPVEVWPGHSVRSIHAAQWFSGEALANEADDYLVEDIADDEQDVLAERSRRVRGARRLHEARSQFGVADMNVSFAGYEALRLEREAAGSAEAEAAKRRLDEAETYRDRVRADLVQLCAEMITLGLSVTAVGEGSDPIFDDAVAMVRKSGWRRGVE